MTMPIAYVAIRPEFAQFTPRLRSELAASTAMVSRSTTAMSGAMARTGTAAAASMTRTTASAARSTSAIGASAVRSAEAVAVAGTGVFTRMRESIKSLAAFALPMLGAIAAYKFVKESTDAAAAEARTMRGVAQTLKTTHDASRMTSASIKELAKQTSIHDGVTRSAVLSGEAMLLVFKNIKNQVGKNNDIFSQATRLAVDMSAKLGTSIPSAARMLGRALEDPARGMNALRRVGVILDAQQQESIKNYAAHGQALKAQKVFLDALSQAVGGQAAAQASAGDKMKASWESFRVELGDKIRPVLGTVYKWITANVIPALSRLMDNVGHGTGVFAEMRGVVRALLDVLGPLFTGAVQVLGAAWRGLVAAFKASAPYLHSIGQWIRDNATLVRTLVVAFLTLEVAYRVIMKVRLAVLALNFVMAHNPAVLFAAAIVAIGAAFAYAYTHSEKFRSMMRPVTDWMRSHALLTKTLVIALGTLVASYLALAVAQQVILKLRLAMIALNLTLAVNPIILIVSAAAALVVALIYAYKHSERFRSIVDGVWRALKPLRDYLLWTVKATVGLALGFVTLYKHSETFRDILHGVFSVLQTVFHGFITAIEGIPHAFDNVMHAADNVRHAFDNVWHAGENVAHAISNTVHAIEVAWRDFWGALVAAWNNVGHPIFTGISAVVGFMVDVFKANIATMKFVWRVLWDTLTVIWTVGARLFDLIWKTAYAIFGIQIKLIIEAFTKLWHLSWSITSAIWRDVGRPIFDAISTTVQWLWRDVIKPVANFIVGVFRVLWDDLKSLWTNVGHPIFTAIVTVSHWLFKEFKAVGDDIAGMWRRLWGTLSTIWRTVGKAVIKTVGNDAVGLWNNLKKVFGWISTGWNKLWGGMGTGFSMGWGVVKSAVATGVNAVVTAMNWFITAIDWILDKLPGHIHIDKLKKFSWGGSGGGSTGNGIGGGVYASAEGGVLPGGKHTFPGYAPGRDHISMPLALFSGGEGVLTPETTRALGGEAGIRALNRMHTPRMGGSVSMDGHHDLGGFLGGLGKALKKGVGEIGSLVRSGTASALRAALGLAERPVKSAINAIHGEAFRDVLSGGFNQADSAIRSMIDSLGGKARKAAAATIPGGGAVIPAQYAAEVAYAASQFAHYGWDVAGNMPSLKSLWMGESGWNPHALNSSSGAYGIPQSLPASKMASAGADWQNNPATQIRWGLNYIHSVYGNPAHTYSTWLSRQPHWYAKGAWNVAATENAMLHKGEMVVPVREAEAFRIDAGKDKRLTKAEVKTLWTRAHTLMVDMKGYLAAVPKGAADTKTAFTKLATALVKTTTVPSGFRTHVNNEETKVLSLLTKAASLSTTITTQQAKLTDLQGQRGQKVSDVSSNIMGGFNISSAGGNATTADNHYAPVSGASILADLKAQVTRAVQFNGLLVKLKKAGLNPTLIDQLVQAGPAAMQQAQALSSTTPAGIKSINSTYASLATAATAIGNTAGDALYGAGIATVTGYIKGLQSQQKSLRAQAQKLANTVVTEIKKKLKIKSPSEVTTDLGYQVGRGPAIGMGRALPELNRMTDKLSNAMTPKLPVNRGGPTTGVSGGMDAKVFGAAVAAALSGMTLVFDSDGLVRFIDKKQGLAALKGVRR